MKLLANENFPNTSVRILRLAGYDICSIGDDFPGIMDEEVVQLAVDENRTILTFDSDYGELIFKHGYKPSAGVIYLRWEGFQPDEPGNLLVEILKSGKLEFSGMLTVISKNSIRQRAYL
ncbi:MAG: DUF5615 family PIN-like protein [Bacteroidales bacterium]|nr:DUF5615 family PIN-like protein [Bacteroidales bacterium]